MRATLYYYIVICIYILATIEDYVAAYNRQIIRPSVYSASKNSIKSSSKDSHDYYHSFSSFHELFDMKIKSRIIPIKTIPNRTSDKLQIMTSKIMPKLIPIVIQKMIPMIIISTFLSCSPAVVYAANVQINNYQNTLDNLLVTANVPGVPSELSNRNIEKSFRSIDDKMDQKMDQQIDKIESTATSITEKDKGKEIIKYIDTSTNTDENSNTALKKEADTPILTASEILKSNIEPKIASLKDIQQSFNLYPNYLDKRDYEAFRKGLRSAPAMDLRKTCKLVKPLLVLEKQKKFDEIYNVMINCVNDMDTLALKRVQGTGIPEKEKEDEQMLILLNNAIKNLNELIVVTSSIYY